jgi:hypothetical protein
MFRCSLRFGSVAVGRCVSGRGQIDPHGRVNQPRNANGGDRDCRQQDDAAPPPAPAPSKFDDAPDISGAARGLGGLADLVACSLCQFIEVHRASAPAGIDKVFRAA